MKKPNFKQGWAAIIQWKGWKTFGALWVKAWRGTVCWSGWKVLFRLPFPLVLLLCVACGGGLFWAFANGQEAKLTGYCLYPLSAYALLALCVKLPGGIRGGKQWISSHPKLRAFLTDKESRFRRHLYFDQIINFAYGSFKIASGVILGSAWIGCDGIYNMTQSLIQLFQIFRRKYAKTQAQQWKSYRFCGVLILLMHLTLIGLVFQMINWNRAVERGEILVITTALFAFYKIISSFIRIGKDRKHVRPVDSSVRMLNLAQAFFAVFSLQASMFHTFGTGESWENRMNILTGCAVCLLIVSIGIYMIRRANREIKLLQEKNDGE